MRERRYKYTVWGGPFGKLRDRDSFGTASELASGEPAEPVELAVNSEKGIISFNPTLGARSKGSNGGVAVGLPHRNSSVFKQTPYQ